MAQTQQERFTRRDLLRRYGVQGYVFDYATGKAGLEAAERVGPVKVFLAEQIPAIEAALAATRRRRERVEQVAYVERSAEVRSEREDELAHA